MKIIKRVAEKLWKSTSAAILLSCVAGLVDAVGYVRLFHLFMGFMSGNSIILGISLGLGRWHEALVHMIPILCFLVGVGGATELTKFLVRRRVRFPTGILLSLEGALVGAYLFSESRFLWGVDIRSGWNGIGGVVLLVAFLTMAMGIQTAALQRVGGHSVHTTFITGLLTKLAGQSAAALRKSIDEGVESVHTGPAENSLLSPEKPFWIALAYVLYVAGAAAGSWGVRVRGISILFAAIVLLAAAVALDLLNPLPPSIQNE